MLTKTLPLLFLFLTASFLSLAQTEILKFENSSYHIEANASSIKIRTKNQVVVDRVLKPVVQIIRSENDPLMAEKKSDNNLSPQVAWNNPKDLKKIPVPDEVTSSKADFYKNGGNETDFYKTGNSVTVQATSVLMIAPNQVRYSFKKNAAYTLTLDIILPAGNEAPLFETQISVKQKGWYSVGFTGISPQDTADLDFLYQPMIWTWKRFPEKPYLTSEKFATTAASFTNNGTFTEGITPDPSEIPYRFATADNSRFGFILRNAAGRAQPMIFAPILGGENSFMNKGQTFRFKTRYVLQAGDWYSGLSYILKDIFHYKNERKNASVTLNQTLDNIIGIAMNDKSGGWIDSLKGFDYVQDAVGTVKVVSALHQLGAAMVSGNEDIYFKRALPTMGYVMSREKYLFTTDERQKIQSPSHLLKGPCVEIGELSGLYQLTQGQTFAFRSEMDRLFGKSRKLNLNTETGGGTWQDYLYRYRVTNNSTDLQRAKEGADKYVKNWQPYPSDFTNDPGLRDKGSAFLTDFTPKLYDLIELFEETKDQKYLDMATSAARQMVLWTRSNPMAPATNIRVNKGGKVTGVIGKRFEINSYEYLPGFNDTTEVPEQQVAAWQTSLVGLPPEQPYTYGKGPIMLTHHPAWFLKLAYLAKDTLLKTAAYNAILGRYAGFPGYYYTSLHTNVYQAANYAAHGYWDIKYNAIFHNHIFPHITLLIDFLVNDAFYRSDGNVDFPGIYAPGYAYLSSKVYGSKLGTVFGNKDIRIWLPANAIQSNTVAFNHVLGIAKDDLYVILMNTFNEKVTADLRLNPDVIHWIPEKEYSVTVYFKDGNSKKSTFKNGLLKAEIAAQELAAFKIESLKVDVPLFDKMNAEKVKGGSESFLREENTVGFGTVTGMLINTFPQFSDAFIFTDKTAKELKEVSIEYRVGSDEWTIRKDLSYPFEFDIHLKNPGDKLEFRLKALDLNGKDITGKTYLLKNE